MFTGSVFSGDLRPWGWIDGDMEKAFGESFEQYQWRRQMIEQRESLKSLVEIDDKLLKVNHRAL
jgi:hypothetical protein